VPPKLADDLYPCSQCGSARIKKPFRWLREQASYPISRTISVVSQCAQGVDASNKGFFRSRSQTQAWNLTP
jgi:hypothetical protein